ncbi:MAG: DUF2812 domain-containing protein [Bacteroidia bacterium]|nr:DUF2812 domain-containing protein [Bacteroidia bacterium]
MEKTVRRNFFVWEYEKEEKWLNKMSSEGWQLVQASLFKYKFENGEPDEYEYKLELLDKDTKNKESRAYLDFLQETNVELIGEVSNWIYLRKKKSEGGFSDDNRLIRKVTHSTKIGEIYQNIMILFLSMIAISVVGIMIFHDLKTSPATSFFEGFFTGIVLASSIISVLLIPAIKKNQKKIRRALRELVVAERG